MAWTSPMTFTPNSVLTAAQLNTHLRDNFLELEVAKASQAGALFTGERPNKIEQRSPKSSFIPNTQSISKADYGNLSNVGPQVTINTGKNAMVFIAAAIGSAVTQLSAMSYQITGATKSDPSDSKAICIDGIHASKDQRWCQMIVEDNLNPGLNTFTAKYKSGQDTITSTFHDRLIAVWPF